VLSIFALIGLQIYQGTLKQKCIRIPENNSTWFLNLTQAVEDQPKNATLKAELLNYTENRGTSDDRDIFSYFDFTVSFSTAFAILFQLFAKLSKLLVLS